MARDGCWSASSSWSWRSATPSPASRAGARDARRASRTGHAVAEEPAPVRMDGCLAAGGIRRDGTRGAQRPRRGASGRGPELYRRAGGVRGLRRAHRRASAGCRAVASRGATVSYRRAARAGAPGHGGGRNSRRDRAADCQRGQFPGRNDHDDRACTRRAVEADACWVETIARPGCGACASGQGCGGGVIGRLLGERRHAICASCCRRD
jgi:hypothetical protein